MEFQNCPNCGHAIADDKTYCPECGQKNSRKRITLRELLSDFFDSIFNLNSALFHTLRDLFIPARLTIRFFQGKRKSYYPPLRLFFVTMLAFYTLLGIKYLGKIEGVAGQSITESLREQRLLREVLDSSELRLSGNIQMTEAEQDIVDTLHSYVMEEFDRRKEQDGNSPISLNIGRFDTIPPEEFALLDPDSLIRKYEIEGFWNRLSLRQAQKIFRQPESMLQFLIGNTTWMLIALIPFVAGCMKLLYFRRKKYFIEHVIFLFHYHSFVFLSLVLYFLFVGFLPDWMLPAFIFLLLAFFWTALWKYYSNGVVKTSVKFLLILLFYLFAFLLFIIITSLVSFLIFQ